MAVLKASDNYLNLKMLPIVSEEEITRIFKPDFDASGSTFDAAELRKSYHDTTMNLA